MANGLIRINARQNIFSDDYTTHVVSAGQTLSQSIVSAGLEEILLINDGTRLFVNDWLVPRTLWGEVVLTEKDIVAIVVLPESGGTGRTIAMLAGMAAAMVATYGAGAALMAPGATALTAGQSMLAAGAGMAVSLAGSLAVNAIFPPQAPNMSSDERRIPYYITGQSNEIAPYSPVDRIYGKHITYPKHASAPYSELVGKDQYFRCLFLIGKGRYDLSAHKIGTTTCWPKADSDFTNIQLKQYYVDSDLPSNELPIFDLFPSEVHTDAFSTLIEAEGDWVERTTEADTDEIGIEVTFTSLFQLSEDGETSPSTVVFEVEYSEAGEDDWIPYHNSQEMDLARYLVVGYPDDHLFSANATYVDVDNNKINWSQPYGSGAEIRFRAASGGSLPGGLSAGTTYTVLNADESSIQVSSDGINAIDITSTGSGQFYIYPVISGVTPGPTAIAVGTDTVTEIGGGGASGVIRYAWKGQATISTGRNNWQGRPIFITIQFWDRLRVELDDVEVYFVDDDAVTVTADSVDYAWEAADIDEGAWSIEDEVLETVKYGINISVPTGTWDVRIRRTDEQGSDDHDDVYFTAVQSIKHAQPALCDKATYVAMRIKATDQLSGMVDQYNCIAESLIEAYDSTTRKWELVKTRNCAWVFCDVFCGTSIEKPLAHSRLDLTAISAWAETCEPADPRGEHIGLWFDGRIDFRTTVWELSQLVATVGNASRGISLDGKITVVEDKANTAGAVQAFGPRNTWDYEGSKAFIDLPHCLKIRIAAEDENYQQVEVPVYDDDYDSGTATIFETWDLFGCTDKDNAWLWGRRQIAAGRLRPESHSFTTNISNLVCKRGDLVEFAHDVISVGYGQGRIKSYTLVSPAETEVETITIDNAFPMAAGGSYGIRIAKMDGTQVTATVATVAGERYTLTLTSTVNATDIEGGELVFFGVATLETMQCLVQRIDPGKDLTARINLIPYNAAVYTAGDGDIPDWDPIITIPPVINLIPPTPTIIGTKYWFHRTMRTATGRKAIMLRVSWDFQTNGFDRTNWKKIQGYEVQYRKGSSKWELLVVTGADARSAVFEVSNEKYYDIRVRSYTTPGAYSAWDTESNVYVDLDWPTPDPVTDLAIKGGSWTTPDLIVEWTDPTDPAQVKNIIKDYKIVVKDGSDNVLRTAYRTQTHYRYSFDTNVKDGDGTPAATIKIDVYSRDEWNELSATADSVTATNAAPADPTNLSSVSKPNKVTFDWDANSEKDFSHFLVRTKVATDDWSSWRHVSGLLLEGDTTVSFTRHVSNTELDDHGPYSTIYFEVKAVDVFGQASSAVDTSAVIGYDEPHLDPNNMLMNESFETAYSNGVTTQLPAWGDNAASESSGGNGSNGYATITRAGTNLVAAQQIWKRGTARYFPVKPGEVYEIGGDVKSSNGSVVARISAAGYDKDKSFTSTLCAVTSTETSWTTIGSGFPDTSDGVFVVPAGTKFMLFNLSAYTADGTASFDNVWLRKVDPVLWALLGGWSSPGDAITIDGGNIWVESSVAIGSGPDWHDTGIQLQYNAGSPRFFAGDYSGGNYIEYTSDGLVLSSDAADGIVVKSGGNLKLESGGDIVMDAAAGNRSLVKWKVFDPAGYTYISMGVDYSNAKLCVYPASDGADYFIVGKDPADSAKRFYGVDIRGKTYANLRSYFTTVDATDDASVLLASADATTTATLRALHQSGGGSEDYAQIVLTASDALNKIEHLLFDDGNNRSLQHLVGSFGPVTDSVMTCGTDALRWSNGYFDALNIGSGGTLDMVGDSSNDSNIKWTMTGPEYIYQKVDFDNKVMAINTSDNTAVFNIGYTIAGATNKFGTLNFAGKDYAKFRACYGTEDTTDDAALLLESNNTNSYATLQTIFQTTGGSEDYCKIYMATGDASNYIEFVSMDDGTSYAVRLNGSVGFFGPMTDKQLDCGRASYAWDDVYADDFQNVADFLHLDSRDDLAELLKIKGSGRIDVRTGEEIIDDDTVPKWLLSKDKLTGEILLDSVGRPYISSKMMLSLLMGCCRQIANEFQKKSAKGKRANG